MSDKIKITFPDGNSREYDGGVSAYEVAKSISEGLAKEILVAEVNGEMKDLHAPIGEDASIVFHKFDSNKGKEVYWHTTSHLMAQAVEELFPGAKFGVGPSIENGFYYDIDTEKKFAEEDLRTIEKKMAEIAARDLKPEREDMPRLEAIEYFKTKREDPYKVEILETIAKDAENVSLYHQGDFTDLCRGPHLPTTKKINAIKLLSVSGSYWRGDEKRQMLQRIYGVSFPKEKDLQKYLDNLEEAKRRDHRKLGRDLELFFFDEVSPGAPFWLPNGMVIFKELEKFVRELLDSNGYQEVNTPILVKESLFNKSGHVSHYDNNMFKIDDDEEKENMYLKPMNCPESTMVYSSKIRSYKDLPIRLSEIGRLHRNELRGALGGMFRVRQITMDDGHIFCTEDQIEEEITSTLAIVKEFYSKIGFTPNFYLSTRPEDSMGDAEVWDRAEKALEASLVKNELDFKINEGDGAFYGPKIDINIKDALNRSWQLATIQLDFNMPNRFELSYEGSDGNKHCPVMIHRALLGSFERFIGIITEHYAGNFPVWLSPVQVSVLSITDSSKEYALGIYEALKNEGVRVVMDERNEKISYKISEAERKKIPYMIIVGDKEKEGGNISLRKHGKGDVGKMELKEFIENIRLEIGERRT